MRTCSVAGCDARHEARGLCKKHYLRWKRETDPGYRERENARRRESRRGNPEYLAYEARRRQAPGWRAKHRELNRKAAAKRRLAMYPTWAAYWEAKRREQDLEELNQPAPPGPICRVSDRPRTRTFVAGACRGCGSGWVDYPARQPSGYCTECQKRRWRKQCNHVRRMRLSKARVEVVSPDEVFRRDGYVCQLCGKKAVGVHPAPNSPTLDHIIPLSRGGEHSYQNTQCACWRCNTLKGDRIDNTQLRLVG